MSNEIELRESLGEILVKFKRTGYPYTIETLIADAVDSIISYPVVQRMLNNGWISFPENKPDEFEFYVIRYKSGGWIMAQYMPDGWYTDLPVAGRTKILDRNPVVAYMTPNKYIEASND